MCKWRTAGVKQERPAGIKPEQEGGTEGPARNVPPKKRKRCVAETKGAVGEEDASSVAAILLGLKVECDKGGSRASSRTSPNYSAAPSFAHRSNHETSTSSSATSSLPHNGKPPAEPPIAAAGAKSARAKASSTGADLMSKDAQLSKKRQRCSTRRTVETHTVEENFTSPSLDASNTTTPTAVCSFIVHGQDKHWDFVAGTDRLHAAYSALSGAYHWNMRSERTASEKQAFLQEAFQLKNEDLDYSEFFTLKDPTQERIRSRLAKATKNIIFKFERKFFMHCTVCKQFHEQSAFSAMSLSKKQQTEERPSVYFICTMDPRGTNGAGLDVVSIARREFKWKFYSVCKDKRLEKKRKSMLTK
jgi:hypothetical protein